MGERERQGVKETEGERERDRGLERLREGWRERETGGGRDRGRERRRGELQHVSSMPQQELSWFLQGAGL